MAKFTPEEAFMQGRLDMMAVDEALVRLAQQFGPLSKEQKLDITATLLCTRYNAHVAAGHLEPYNPVV